MGANCRSCGRLQGVSPQLLGADDTVGWSVGTVLGARARPSLASPSLRPPSSLPIRRLVLVSAAETPALARRQGWNLNGTTGR